MSYSMFLLLLGLSSVQSFSPFYQNRNYYSSSPKLPLASHLQRQRDRNRSVELNLLWFGGDGDKSKKGEKDQGDQKQSKSKMGTTATTMENFKQSQELGKKTGALLNDLSAANVEGTAAKGKIKVILDGEQRPKMVEIDEEYFQEVAVEDFTEALISAMQDAYLKSTTLMEDKMSGLYAELGLVDASKTNR